MRAYPSPLPRDCVLSGGAAARPLAVLLAVSGKLFIGCLQRPLQEMLLHQFLLLALLLVLVLFSVIVIRFHSHELPSTQLIFRRHGGSGKTTFNNTTPSLEKLLQQLGRLEATNLRMWDELNEKLGKQEEDTLNGNLQQLASLQLQINKLHQHLDAMPSSIQMEVKSESTKQNMSEELSRIYLAIQRLEQRISEGRFDHQIQVPSGKFNITGIHKFKAKADARRGTLTCNGREVDSEVIYWDIVPGDAEYESPYRRRNENNKKFLTFKYDPAGYNNMRMSFESLAVLAHAMGRVFVIPPEDHLELLRPQSEEEKKKHAEMHRNSSKDMGFDEIFNMELLRSQKGFSTMTIDEFIETEAKAGHIKGIYPPAI